MDTSGKLKQRFSNVEASYEIAVLIARNNKSHNMGESCVKPRITVAANDGALKTGNYRSKKARYQKG